jgi:hypothetical protein
LHCPKDYPNIAQTAFRGAPVVDRGLNMQGTISTPLRKC